MSGADVPLNDDDLGRLLAYHQPPEMASGLVDRVVAEAIRADRPRLPPQSPRRSLRRWPRRSVITAIVAINLIAVSAIAATYGGGVISFAAISSAARTIVHHIRHPHHHIAPKPRSPSPHAQPPHLERGPGNRRAIIHARQLPARARRLRDMSFHRLEAPTPRLLARPARRAHLADRRFGIHAGRSTAWRGARADMRRAHADGQRLRGWNPGMRWRRQLRPGRIGRLERGHRPWHRRRRL